MLFSRSALHLAMCAWTDSAFSVGQQTAHGQWSQVMRKVSLAWGRIFTSSVVGEIRSTKLVATFANAGRSSAEALR